LSELAEAFYRHLLSLLPPGRYPREGGAADGTVRMLGALEASAVEETLALFRQALPQYAEGAFLEEVGRGRGLSRFQGELEAAFRNRVVYAVRFWLLGGTLPGMRLWLEAAGYEAHIHEHFRDDPSIWAEFSLYLWPIAQSSPRTAGTTGWGRGTTTPLGLHHRRSGAGAHPGTGQGGEARSRQGAIHLLHPGASGRLGRWGGLGRWWGLEPRARTDIPIGGKIHAEKPNT
jgi:hypothetical protein